MSGIDARNNELTRSCDITTSTGEARAVESTALNDTFAPEANRDLAVLRVRSWDENLLSPLERLAYAHH